VTTYGAESWTLNKDIAKRLATFEKKILKELSGEVKQRISEESDAIKNSCSCLEI
jgi:hypothetical protein